MNATKGRPANAADELDKHNSHEVGRYWRNVISHSPKYIRYQFLQPMFSKEEIEYFTTYLKKYHIWVREGKKYKQKIIGLLIFFLDVANVQPRFTQYDDVDWEHLEVEIPKKNVKGMRDGKAEKMRHPPPILQPGNKKGNDWDLQILWK